jgi:hypothetical protein
MSNPFIIIDTKLFVRYAALVESGISANTIRNAKLRNAPSWSFIDDPEDKRKVLADFEALKDEYKDRVTTKYGNPYERIAKQPIRDLIKWDHQAEEFYLAYRYTGTDGNQKPLPTDTVKKYTAASNFLNVLKRMTEDKRQIKQLTKLTIDQFWKTCCDIIEEDNLDLPASYRRLCVNEDSALKKYIATGYASLIDHRFGNTRAAKVNDEVSQAVINKFLSDPRQYDDMLICMMYNQWAKDNNYKAITHSTVGVWREKLAHEIVMEREGNHALRNKFMIMATGTRPSAPLMLVENDDNSLDLLFNVVGDARAERRYVMMAVKDSFNDHLLGYSVAPIGELEKLTIPLIQSAYLNAMYYIRSLTGGWYMFNETKSDRYALASLRPFYKQISNNYNDTPTGSKNGRYIEQTFGKHHWKRCMKLSSPDGHSPANNYSGNNISAKYRGVNMEWLARNKKNRPFMGEEAERQINHFAHLLRHLPQTTKAAFGVSKEQQWLDAWNAMSDQHKIRLTDEQFLLKFGIEHNPGEGKVNRISNKGVNPIICGTQFRFTIDGDWRPHEGKAVKIIYDPNDMSRALITDHQQVRFMAHETNRTARAIADATTNTNDYLRAYTAEKRDTVKSIAAKNEKRDLVLAQHGFDGEAFLLGGGLDKPLKAAAEQSAFSKMLNPRGQQQEFDDADILEQM